MKRGFAIIFVLMGWLVSASAEVYQSPAEFVAKTFVGETPEVRAVWLAGELKQGVREIMGHDLGVLRVRYWVLGPRTAWILEEIGKEALITTGIVVNAGTIESIEVLIYRETRGFEVRYPFFLNQFRGAGLEENDELDRKIDGISGATLSVHALTRLGRLALFLDRQVGRAGARKN